MVDFFNSHGEEDLYGQGFLSRHHYVRDKLNKLNGTDRLKAVVAEAFEFGLDRERETEDAAFQFNKVLSRDGFRLVKDYHAGFMQGDEYIEGEMFFRVKAAVDLSYPLTFGH
ncbi:MULTISPECIES: hypothetical protein [unclassified Aliiroseovarius]|uniref:hypothetical protein n=1 Tax=unclassified Aliiroseovarius TaxID=2623558 RepID=UPI0015683BCE|nr:MULTISPECIES: hypothetical protein [unclassified Aliiroseovarius]